VRLRRGFSLLEILLALSLGVVLLTAIGAAIDQSWKLSAQGQTELQRQQVARAVLRILERDLRSAMFVPTSDFAEDEEESSSPSTIGTPSNGASSGSASDGTSTNTSSTVTQIGGEQQQTVLSSRGIRGEQAWIEIDGNRPQKELAYATPVNETLPSSRTSDFRTIMYWVAAPGQANDPQGRGGLSRKEGDRYAIASAETAGRDASQNFSPTLLAPEIDSLTFRYFDGAQWLPMWDSVSYGSLPRAVEVQLHFAPPPANRAMWLNAAVNRATETVRLVIFVPSADPAPEETEP
jgi:prepilin-type N-terminal cleavage/methylation domain-containing protein